VVPRIYSTDPDGGDQREFLAEYFDDMPSMATNIFLKGYQWPFDAQRITDHQSSLIDMAVHQETVVRGRRVWMDFLRNLVGAEGWAAFDIESLGDEALDYLRKTGATQATPLDRLRHMNPPAIDIYGENGIDLSAEPLEIAVCAQHMNGGFAVNKWWESNVAHTFVIGEMAGTHGVKRPGGSALNAGQVGAVRAAEYIANAYAPDELDPAAAQAVAGEAVARMLAGLSELRAKAPTAPRSCDEAMEDIRRRMTRHGAHLRSRAGAAEALRQAGELYAELTERGLRLDRPGELRDAVGTIQQCLAHMAILKAICALFDRGAGSRGSHCILDEKGVAMHPLLRDPATNEPYRFRPENEALREQILHVAFDPSSPDLFTVRDVPPRPAGDRRIAFEPAWTEYREGTIYRI